MMISNSSCEVLEFFIPKSNFHNKWWYKLAYLVYLFLSKNQEKKYTFLVNKNA